MTLISDNYICRSCRRQEIGLPAATRLQGLLDDREVRLGQRRSRVGADEKMRDRPLIFESFQKHLGETADVSLTLETFPICKCPSLLGNDCPHSGGAQEARFPPVITSSDRRRWTPAN